MAAGQRVWSMRLGALLPLALLLPIPPFCPRAARAETAPSVVDFLTDEQRMSSLAPRREGSERERAALDYIERRLRTAALEPQPVVYTDDTLPHSYSHGLELVIPGERPDTLLIVVPVDHAVDASGRSGGDGGIALAIHLGLRLAASRPPVSVRVVFLGAEQGVGPMYPLGSRRYLGRLGGIGNVAAIYLDVDTLPAPLTLLAASGGSVAPRWIVRALGRALASTGIEYRLHGNLIQLNRLGLDPGTHPLATYLGAGYPAVALVAEGGGASEAETTRWLGAFDTAMDRLLQGLDRGIPTEWDRHYLAFQVGSVLATIPELAYVSLLGALVALCLLYAAFSGARGRRYAVAFGRGCWSVPLHLGLLFLIALVPTLVLVLLLDGIGFPTLWSRAPAEMGLLKVLLSSSLFALLTPLLTRTFLPRGDSFFAASSIVFAGIELCLVAVYQVSLAVYFAWGLGFLFLCTLARGRIVKFALFALAPLLILRALVEMFWLRQMELIRWVLVDRVKGSALLALAAAPYYFMALRLRLLLPARRHRLRRALIAAAGVLLLMAATGVAAWIAYERPYRGGASRPLTAEAVFDYGTGQAELDLRCPIAIGEAIVTTGSGLSRISTRAREARLELPLPPVPLVLGATGVPFLNRWNARLVVDGRSPDSPWPYRLTLRLVSRSEFVVFDGSLPFQRSPGGLEYTISVGAGPPRPLVIDLTLPPGLDLQLVVVALYLELPSDLVVSSEGAVVSPEMEVRSSFAFSTSVGPP